jgi:hypothetical protein
MADADGVTCTGHAQTALGISKLCAGQCHIARFHYQTVLSLTRHIRLQCIVGEDIVCLMTLHGACRHSRIRLPSIAIVARAHTPKSRIVSFSLQQIAGVGDRARSRPHGRELRVERECRYETTVSRCLLFDVAGKVDDFRVCVETGGRLTSGRVAPVNVVVYDSQAHTTNPSAGNVV